MSLLEVKDVTKTFYKLVALNRMNFQLQKGEIMAIIGPNGSGKSTLFNCITHIYPPTEGVIVFGGEEITRTGPDRISRLGIGRTFQLIQVFPDMSVIEGMLLAIQEHQGNIFSRFFLILNENIKVKEGIKSKWIRKSYSK